jgi:hypothetical protein
MEGGMEMDDHGQSEPQSSATGPRRASPGLGFKLAALVLAGVTIASATGFLAARWLRQPIGEAASVQPAKAPAPATTHQFTSWPKPTVALLLSGQQHGYLQPCGCSDPQLGGLARRYNFLQILVKDHGWPVVAADLGDVAQHHGPQARLKYNYSMEAFKLLGYTAVGIGENDIGLPLISGLADFALNNPSPRVLAANLIDKAQNFPGLWYSSAISDGKDGAPRVGFVSVLGVARSQTPEQKDLAAEAANQLGNSVVAEAINKVLPGVLRDLQKQNPELLVLLYEGSEEDAQACATQFPQFHVVMCLSKEELASSRPNLVGNTLVVNVGHRGRYVGLVGAYRTGQAERPFTFRYEMVEIGPEYESPKDGGKDNPVHPLMERYARQVRDENYLAQYVLDAKHPLQVNFPQAAYVGSDKCKKCHAAEFAVWQDHPHSRAYDTLVNKATRPSLRQFDGECVVCHTTGFGYQTGFRNEKASLHLRGVGCESCHGPASLHVKNPNDPQMRAAINPIKRQPKESMKQFTDRLFTSCRKCHDEDNSVHFDLPEFWEKKKTDHSAPRDE